MNHINLINDFQIKSKIQLYHSVNCLIKLNTGNFALGESSGYLKIYNSKNYKLEVSIYCELNGIDYICELRDNIFIVCSNKSISIWEILNKEEPYLINIFQAHNLSISKVIKISNGNFASCSKEIKIWNSNHPYQLIQNLKGHNKIIKSIIQLSDLRIVSVSSLDENILIYWNIENGKKEKIINNINCANHSSLIELPNFKIGVGGKCDIFIINNLNYQIEIIIKAHFSFINSLLLYNDTLLSCSEDGNIKQWDLINYQCISSKLKAHNNYIILLLELNNEIIISSSDNGTVLIWEKI